MSAYSNARAEARKANPGVNTTQRSWSNYEGNRPQRSWVGTNLYRDSSKYGVGGSDVDRFGGGNKTQRSWDNYVGEDPAQADAEANTGAAAQPPSPPTPTASQWQQLQDRVEADKLTPRKESQWGKLRRESALRKGMRSMRDSGVAQSTNPVA